MYLIKIFNENKEIVYEGNFQDLLIREARGITVERERGEPVRRYPNQRHSLELKLWSGMQDFSMGEDLNSVIELEG